MPWIVSTMQPGLKYKTDTNKFEKAEALLALFAPPPLYLRKMFIIHLAWNLSLCTLPVWSSQVPGGLLYVNDVHQASSLMTVTVYDSTTAGNNYNAHDIGSTHDAA